MSPVTQILPCDQFLSKAGSVGILLPNLEARLVGEGGIDVNPGECGELWFRGPTVMKVDVCGCRVHAWIEILILCTLRVT